VGRFFLWLLSFERTKESSIPSSEVGDLYDHTRNCDPAYFTKKDKTQDKTSGKPPANQPERVEMTIKNTGQLWDAMNFRQYENEKNGYDVYPRGIDGLLMLSRIIDFYGKHKKPVIYVSGNHEGYERPFGISPRLRIKDDNPLWRANAGIPSDHNLTIYEAALLYGDKSYDLGLELSKLQLNFKGANLDWLYCLYTPWKDFIFSYTVKNKEEAAPVIGKPKPNADTLYNFVCLGWGKDEDFLKSAASDGGTLPRAPASCDDTQMKLVKWAVDSKAKYNLLLTHFTFVSYDRDKPFDDKKAYFSVEKGETIKELGLRATEVHLGLPGIVAGSALLHPDVNGGNPFQRVKKTYYDIGSFYQNRPAMYELLKDALVSYENLPTIARSGKIHYVLSGHAHRPGAYTFTRLGDDFAAKAWLYKDPDKPEPSLDLRALGRDVVNARCLVCGAAGPYSYRNLKGELGGFGMARPQGMILDIPNDSVEWKEAEGQLPRLAVVMESLWYIGDCPPFGSDALYQSDGLFFMQLNGDFMALFSEGGRKHPFACVKLIAVGTGGNAILTMYPDSIRSNTLQMRLNPGDFKAFKKRLEMLTSNNGTIFGHFLSITFTEVPGVFSKDDYDLTSPWCFPVNTDDNYIWIHRRSGTSGGETPDWANFYAQYWGNEYYVNE